MPTQNDPSMRLGFSFLYFTPRVTEEHHRWIERCAAHGYQGVELPMVGAEGQEPETLRKVCEQNGVATIAVGNCVPGKNPISPDPAERRAGIAQIGELCERTARLGAEVLMGPVHSAYGVRTGLPPTSDEWNWCVEALQQAGEHAARCGVTIAVEPLNRFESYFLNTAADCDRLIREVDHDRVVAALDTHHAHIEEQDTCAAIRAHGETLGHIQLSENHRGTPGQGQIDFPAVLSALEDVGYEGWLVVEAFSRQTPDFGSMLCIWRDLDEGPENLLAAGATLAQNF